MSEFARSRRKRTVVLEETLESPLDCKEIQPVHPKGNQSWIFIGKKENEVTQSCPTLWDPMDCSPPGSSVHRILQARTLEWGAISFSRRSFQPRNRTQVSVIAGRFFTNWAKRKAVEYSPCSTLISCLQTHLSLQAQCLQTQWIISECLLKE